MEGKVEMMAPRAILESAVFITFVLAIDAFIIVNIGWFLLPSLISVIPILSIVALVSFLAFVILEDRGIPR